MKAILILLVLAGCTIDVGMPKKFIINERPFGICNDPSALESPQGALDLATNCISNRDGYLEPRYGANEVSTSGTVLTKVTRMFESDDDLLMYDYTANKFEWLGTLGTEVEDEDSNSVSMFPSYYNIQRARGNLYVACKDGVRKITGATSYELSAAGILCDTLPFYQSPQNLADYDWFTTGQYVLYKTTHVRKDANDVIVESPPSYPVGYTHAAGADRTPEIRIYLGASVAAGDTVKIYRTMLGASYAAIAASYYLAGEKEINSAHIAAGYADYVDKTAQTDLSAALYTNSERQGALKGNYRPPAAKVIAQYKDSTFYSNVIEPSRKLVTMRNSTADLGGVATGAGARQLTGNSVNGSDRITGAAPMAGVAVGQYIYGTNIPLGTYVRGFDVGASWIDMTEDATGTAAISLSVKDTITFGYGSTYETHVLGSPTNWADNGHNAQYLLVNALKDTSSDYIVDVLDPQFDFSAGMMTNTFRVERRALNSSTFHIWATHGLVDDDSYDPYLSPPTYDVGDFVFNTANGLESDMLVKPSRQYWSKADQPEHVPTTNNHDIGDASAIIGTVMTKDGLIVFKDDGIYSVTGEGATSGWVVRTVELGTVLVTSNCAIHIDGWVYALTNKGLARVNVYGVELLSDPYIDAALPTSSDSIRAEARSRISSRRAGNEVSSAWLAYDTMHNNIIISLSSLNTYTVYPIIYNLKTGAFTTWTFLGGVYHALSVGYDDFELYYAGPYCVPDDGNILWKYNARRSRDYKRLRFVATKPDSEIINFTADHNAAVGDYIIEGSPEVAHEILTIIDSDSLTVADNTDISGSCNIYTPITQVIRWRPKYGETAAIRKKFVAYGFMFEGYPTKYSVLFANGGTTYGPFDLTQDTVRSLVPFTYMRLLEIEPTITIEEPLEDWKLMGFSLEYFLQAPRGV